ncbi:MAG: protein phosphatase 2C domain-containing protein [Brachybacterium sp.]|uniref:protein phosphatase 2C domain-containing protein n=1 Tax=Brachybacterium sp. TaxID=1891286 RepID=UPI002649BECE|nr:protein phosphatase 2C domain-containing protein [Brachybacterium sp.]MDN5688648.1 protein phosphatase 2C domain-containing protein [Brachybacterium sp.]
MHTLLLSDPAGTAPNEDAAGVLGEVAVMLDGAGLPQRFRAGCHHSVAWFSHTLAARLLSRAQDPSTTLRDALAGAIAEVRGLHEGECDLAAGSPSATVVAVRRREEHLEHLVLSDSALLLHHRDGRVHRITDLRIDEVVAAEPSAEAVEARRNAPGGFWVARHEEQAAEQARAGSTPLASLASAHLVSDGVTRAVDLLGLHDDSSLAGALEADPDGVVRALRHGEEALAADRRPRKMHDDATVLTFLLDRG